MVFAGVLAILGALAASFVGVLAERVHTGTSWANDRSRCDSCQTTLTALDLFPVLSWLLMRGRCRHCGSSIPARHALVEATVAAVWFAAALMLGSGVSLVFFLAASLVLLFIVLYDIRHTIVSIIPVVGFVLLSLLFVFTRVTTYMEFGATLIVSGLLASVFLLFYVLSRGRAMGLGDTPVAFGLSLLVGPALALPGLLFSFWIGALYGVLVLVSTPRGHRMGIEVPFVPFLALGYLLVFFTGWNPLPLF